MFDKEKLDAVLVQYKQEFVPVEWKKEKYKWVAVKHFQDNWDIEAPDFKDMLERSLAKTFNLLASMNNFPRGMILDFAGVAPEEVRSMFLALYDESRDVFERIDEFKSRSTYLLKTYRSEAKQHYQNENSISTYLWLRYPDKYYIYKYGEVRKVSELLSSDHQIIKGHSVENVHNQMWLYDELCEELKKDEELWELLQSQLTDECYPDPELKTLTIDVGFYISRYYSEQEPVEIVSDDWWPSLEEYSPGFTKDQWLDLLRNPNVIGPVWGGTLAAFYEAGGTATCSQIAERYNRTPFSISGNCTQLAKRIHKITHCELYNNYDGRNRYWPILFQGKNAGSDVPGVFLWKLRPELMEALGEFDILRYQWANEIPKELPEEIDLDDLQSNANFKQWFSPLVDALLELGGSAPRLVVHERIISNCNIPEDELEKKSKSGYPIITNQFDWSRNYLNYEGFMDSSAPSGTWALSELGKKVVMTDELAGKIIAKWVKIKAAQRENRPLPEIDLTPFYTYRSQFDKYSKADFLEEVFMTEEKYNQLKALLKNKKNIILQGAPGVGKTFAAQRLAWSIMGEKDNSRIEIVQFHQNYSYEDFILGYKPTEDGFALREGIFYRFCVRAGNEPDKPFFFIIDEINRGNLSKIFGELLMLIERDYRGERITLAYNGMPFSVPKNVYIIGMMNTADRSLAMIDYALRRRFSFFPMEPGFDAEGFLRYRDSLKNDKLNALIDQVKSLNEVIKQDKSLGAGFRIGHSYFCGCSDCTDEWLSGIVEYDILPMLEEYWFDDPGRVDEWSMRLRGVLK